MTSGQARTKSWVLTFEGWTGPYIETLMGWTAGDDPLAHIELTFPTLQSALSDAERQAPANTVRGTRAWSGHRKKTDPQMLEAS